MPSIAGFSYRLRSLPTGPGVYVMKGIDGTTLYIGKAANLRSRVRSYFQAPSKVDSRIRAMVSRISDFEYFITASVQEALLLENLLIKEHQPRYNARLKDDKTYPYIKIDPAEAFPQIYFTRRVLPDGARYFGPFASAGSVRKTMDLLKKLFPYRSCTKKITGTDSRPCLEFFIHRCVAPCTGNVDADQYGQVIDQVLRFLEGDSESVTKELQTQMKSASDEMQYERAAILRDQLKAIESVGESQRVVSQPETEADAIALAHDQGEVWVELFKVRRGKLIGREHFLMVGGEAEDDSRLTEQFIQQFYDTTFEVPSLLLIQHQIENAVPIERWLTSKRGTRVLVRNPKRGPKRDLVSMAAQNAEEGLRQKRVRWLADTDKIYQALSEIQESLAIPDLPERIECYDISNNQGSHSVGSMVVFEEGRPKRSAYRRFSIRNVQGIDDYASIKEVLQRRFRYLAENKNPELFEKSQTVDPIKKSNSGRSTGFSSKPTLVIIDGGKGHLNAAQEIFLQLGLTDIPLCSIAKKDEEVFLPQQIEPAELPRQSQGLYLFQRIRDEAHRFAITYHRDKRSQSATKSILDDIPGIGPKRRKSLLRAFGSIGHLRQATPVDVARLCDIPLNLATTVLERVGGSR